MVLWWPPFCYHPVLPFLCLPPFWRVGAEKFKRPLWLAKNYQVFLPHFSTRASTVSSSLSQGGPILLWYWHLVLTSGGCWPCHTSPWVCWTTWFCSWCLHCSFLMRRWLPPYLLMVWCLLFCSAQPWIWWTLSLCRWCHILCQSWTLQGHHSSYWPLVFSSMEDLHQRQPHCSCWAAAGRYWTLSMIPLTKFLCFPLPSFLTTTTPQQHPHHIISICSSASKNFGVCLSDPLLLLSPHDLICLNSAAEVVVMAGSKGKEAFRRPLRHLKLFPGKVRLCLAFTPQAPLTTHGLNTNLWLSAKVWQMLS